MSSMPDQQQILEHFRAALPETTDLTDGQVKFLLNHLGMELSEERLRTLMAAASDESGKVTCERFISWMFGCDEKAEAEKVEKVEKGQDRLQKSAEKVSVPEELQEAIKKLEHEVQEPPEEEVRVDLEDPAALATFLVTANIKLIRAEYLVHLVTQDRRLPRRQEAGGENFVDSTGKTRSALVDHKEVQAWAAGSKEAIIVSVSHAWEAREHPDPCGYQLEWVAQHASLFVAAFAADIWLFFDYVSLFQFKREKEAEEQSFRRSMGNMHAMYAHESTITFRLESLTPEHRWQKAIKDGSQVTIFHVLDTMSGLVEPVPLNVLTRNANAYLDRGWCRAEVSWSSVRGDTAQNQRIDVGTGEMHTGLTGRMPVAPNVFAADMDSAAFTHRSDADAVIELQKKVFLEKVTRRQKLKLEGVSRDQMQALTQSLPHFKQLKSITVIDFECGENEAKAFVEALAATPIEKISLHRRHRARWRAFHIGRHSFVHLLEVIAASLKSNTTITDLDLSGYDVGDRGAKELAEALKENRTLKRLNLAHNRIRVRGVQALEKSLETNTTLERLELDESEYFVEAAEAIEAACRANPRICKPANAQREASDGSDEEKFKSPFEAAGRIKGLADQLRLNKILTSLDLKHQNMCDEQVKALAGAIRVNTTITEVNLANKSFGDEGLKALAEAIRVNKSVTKVNLRGNKFGDEGLKALAEALRVNKTVTEVNLYDNNFGDEGLKALASAMEVNETITEVKLDAEEDLLAMLSDEGRQAMEDIQRFCRRNSVQPVCQSCRSQSITEVNLSRRNLGDEEVKALADALRVNKSVTKVDLYNNKFGDEGLKALADALRVNKSVTEVNLRGNNFGDEGLKALANAFQVNKSVTQVKLGANKFGDEGVKALAEALRVNKTVTKVDLYNNKFGDEGLKALADALRVNKSVTKVDLYNNKFGDEGLKALASTMEVNETITEVELDMEEDELTNKGRKAMEDIKRFCRRNKVQLVCQSCRSQSITEVNLSRRNLGDEEVKALADALRVNKSVTKVDLYNNKFGDEGLKALASTMEVNETITVVWLQMEENQLTNKGRKAMEDIKRCCGRNKVQMVHEVCRSCRSHSITEVDLSGRNLGYEEVKALADAFRVNESVTKVDLHGNNFGDEGLKALADALRLNKSVTTVNLMRNNFGDEGLKALASAMEVNETVTEVKLDMENPLFLCSDEERQAMEDIKRFCRRNKDAPVGSVDPTNAET